MCYLKKLLIGDYTANPFNFANYSATDIGIYVNGESIPGRPLKLNYDDGSYVSAYVRLFEPCGKWNKYTGLYIDRGNFKNGSDFMYFL